MRYWAECPKPLHDPKGRNGLHISDDRTADDLAPSFAGRLAMFSNTLFLTPRPLLNDSVARWLVNSDRRSGLRGRLGTERHNRMAIPLGVDSVRQITCSMCGNLQHCRRTVARHHGLNGGRLRPPAVAFAAYAGAESLCAAHLPCRRFRISAGGRRIDWFDATVFGFDWDAEANWVAAHPMLDWLLRRRTSAYIIKARWYS